MRISAMQTATIARWAMVPMALAVLSSSGLTAKGLAFAAPPELTVPTSAPEERFDFEAKGLDGWTTVNGQWAVEESPERPAESECSSSGRPRTSST
jgi:hypothetical protein